MLVTNLAVTLNALILIKHNRFPRYESGNDHLALSARVDAVRLK